MLPSDRICLVRDGILAFLGGRVMVSDGNLPEVILIFLVAFCVVFLAVTVNGCVPSCVRLSMPT